MYSDTEHQKVLQDISYSTFSFFRNLDFPSSVNLFFAVRKNERTEMKFLKGFVPEGFSSVIKIGDCRLHSIKIGQPC